MGRAGRGEGGGREGRGGGGHGVEVRWEAVLEKVTRSQVGAVPVVEANRWERPGGERSLVVVVSRPSFHMFPILCGFSRSCVGVLGVFI